jgi:hypothetical protein
MYVEVKLTPSETKRGFSKTGYICAIILKGHFQISRAQLSAAVHSRAKCQKPAKNLIFKNREIDGPYLCLQQFDIF